MNPIRVTADFGALLKSPAARTLALLIVVLGPLAWFLYRSYEAASNDTIRLLYALGMSAPACGIVVAIFSFLGFLLSGRRVVLHVADEVRITHSGVSFATADLETLQLFTKEGGAFMALLPHYVNEKLSVATARSGQHNLSGYIVEFPARPNKQTFEVADQITAAMPHVHIEKLGAV